METTVRKRVKNMGFKEELEGKRWRIAIQEQGDYVRKLFDSVKNTLLKTKQTKQPKTKQQFS